MVTSSRVNVTNTPAVLVVGDGGQVHLSTLGTKIAYINLGGPTLTSSNGFTVSIGPQAELELTLKNNEALWAVLQDATASPITVSILRHG